MTTNTTDEKTRQSVPKNERLLLRHFGATARFQPGDALREGESRIDEIMTALAENVLTLQEGLERVTEISERWPESISALKLRAEILEVTDEELAADRTIETAFGIGARLIGDRHVCLDWEVAENRPFLNAAATMTTVLLKRGRTDEAVALMKRMLEWNPSDEGKIARRLGPALLRAGLAEEAGTELERHRRQDAGNEYDLGLLRFVEGKYADAIRALQRGLVANPLIAEAILHDRPCEMNYAAYVTNNELQDAAIDYDDVPWQRSKEALALLRYVETHPLLRDERDQEMVHMMYEQMPRADEERSARGPEGEFEPSNDLIEIVLRKVKIEETSELIWPWRVLAEEE